MGMFHHGLVQRSDHLLEFSSASARGEHPEGSEAQSLFGVTLMVK